MNKGTCLSHLTWPEHSMYTNKRFLLFTAVFYGLWTLIICWNLAGGQAPRPCGGRWLAEAGGMFFTAWVLVGGSTVACSAALIKGRDIGGMSCVSRWEQKTRWDLWIWLRALADLSDPRETAPGLTLSTFCPRRCVSYLHKQDLWVYVIGVCVPA